MVCFDANEKTRKSFEKFRLIKTGSFVKACLIYVNESFASIFHFMIVSFFNIAVTTFTIFAKLGINLLRKFTFPKNDCISFLLLGKPYYEWLELCWDQFLCHPLK